jgi:hypothetical protein
MYGIQVNIGSVTTPDWRWIHGDDMNRIEFQTESEAHAEMSLRHPTYKRWCFRVTKIEECGHD